MKKKIDKKVSGEYKNIANFLFEVGMLAKTPRSGFHFLGTGRQSVAEHVNRTVFIAYTLAQLDGSVDTLKIFKMALLHDISETRISDLNHIHQKYVERKEHSAIADISDTVPFGQDILSTLEEYEKRQSPESIIVKDADILEWIISLKEEIDIGNTRAFDRIDYALSLLKTPIAKKIAGTIMTTESSDWWSPEDSVIRKKKYL
jgi:putative hydrolases of HD superfamily